MRCVRAYVQGLFLGAATASVLLMGSTAAQAGGLAVREQSTSAQGSSFAGSAAGYDLSSMFWNPAAVGIAGWGVTTESHYALIIPDASLTGTSDPNFGGATSTDIGLLAMVPASYAAYRLTKDLAVGLSINSPFGLATKPENGDWQGRFVGRSAKMFTVNATPTVSYQVAPGLFIGAGVQLEYMSLKFKFASNPAVPAQTAVADIEDNLGWGVTGGILWQPSKMTSVGLGYRSSIAHQLEGTLTVPGLADRSITARFDNPEIVTLSVRQAVAAHTRVLGTIEWTNWSRFGVIPIVGSAPVGPGGTDAALPGNWHDSWLYSVGLEHDVSHKLTVRTGVAYEKSPVQNADERLIQVPDSNRWWASGGLTYKWSEKLAFDFAYTHIFFDEAPFVRQNLSQQIELTGEANQSADIVSASMKMRW